MTAVAVLQLSVDVEGLQVREQQRRVMPEAVAVLQLYWQEAGMLNLLVGGACRGMGWGELRARLGG